MQKLEIIFKKLVSNGKLSKGQIVKKLIDVCRESNQSEFK